MSPAPVTLVPQLELWKSSRHFRSSRQRWALPQASRRGRVDLFTLSTKPGTPELQPEQRAFLATHRGETSRSRASSPSELGLSRSGHQDPRAPGGGKMAPPCVEAGATLSRHLWSARLPAPAARESRAPWSCRCSREEGRQCHPPQSALSLLPHRSMVA